MVQDKYDKYDRGAFLPKVNNNKKILKKEFNLEEELKVINNKEK